MERIRIIEAKVVSRNAKVMVPVRKTVIKWVETCGGIIYVYTLVYVRGENRMTKRDERTFRELNDSIDTWIVIAIMLVVRFGIPYAIGYYGNLVSRRVFRVNDRGFFFFGRKLYVDNLI